MITRITRDEEKKEEDRKREGKRNLLVLPRLLVGSIFQLLGS